LIDQRALAMGHARALLGLENDADRLRLGQLVAARECSVRETEQLVRKAQEVEEDSAEEPAAPVVSELLKTKSLQVQLHQRAAGSGKLIVKFADLESRDALVAAIRQIAEL
jgi:ParB family chromosome partitioning protein